VNVLDNVKDMASGAKGKVTFELAMRALNAGRYAGAKVWQMLAKALCPLPIVRQLMSPEVAKKMEILGVVCLNVGPLRPEFLLSLLADQAVPTSHETRSFFFKFGLLLIAVGTLNVPSFDSI
jgi:hypothetical protein